MHSTKYITYRSESMNDSVSLGAWWQGLQTSCNLNLLLVVEPFVLQTYPADQKLKVSAQFCQISNQMFEEIFQDILALHNY